ncbi:MAG: mannose-1-phosphate guanylyltransferase/mannose-6-phosphate isomerase [Betaproteobacteria bacterium]|nr:mannose-1-phosphate guanylyltransferase/mannose-6-phosphate isomerase [Betaproteobacteria bacterium]
MTYSPITPVILCGGSGTRLWPLSRKALPKQFVPLVGDKSLLQLTLERVRLLSPEALAVAAEEHRFLVQEAADAAGVPLRQLLEPEGRNTAAAMAAAACSVAPATLLLFLPADHHIPDHEAFAATVQAGIDAAQAGAIVTFGITPTFPSTAYGYIEQSPQAADPAWGRACAVRRFLEKPDAARAQALLLEGRHFWNAGIFLTRADTLVAALERHAPDILQAASEAVRDARADGSFTRLAREPFARCRSQSIDYAVMEHHERVAMVPFSGAWSDVGSWNAVAELAPPDDDGNRVVGQGHVRACRDTYIHAPHRPVVALGTERLLIVDTADALLVAQADHVEQVRDVVEQLVEAGVSEATLHRRVPRPWGVFDAIDRGERFQVKRITVKPGARLSLQLHHHRAEHWVVVKGSARVTRGEDVLTLHENQSIYIPLGVRHRLENPGSEPLELIEVQSGLYLGEDDIVRFEDGYGRT